MKLPSSAFPVKSTGIPACKRGFTLVEVAMALGIFAFAIVPVLGVMGVALNVSKESVDSTAMSEIFRLVEARTMTSGTTTSSPATRGFSTSGPFYFTNYGEEVTTNGHANAVYQAVLADITSVDAAQGLLARRVVEVTVLRVSGSSDILSQRVLELTKDPINL